MPTYYSVLTTYGESEIVYAIANPGYTISITQFSVGDGSGSATTPNSGQTALVNEIMKLSVNRVIVNPNSADEIIVEGIIPADHSGYYGSSFTVREIGVWDSTGTLFAVSNSPAIVKPTAGEGATADFYVRLIMRVTSTTGFTITVDGSVIGATQDYVDNADKLKLTLGDIVEDFAVSGFTGSVPASGLDLTLTTGVVYADGSRIAKNGADSDMTNTYTPSKDTYVDIDGDGNFTYTEVANGAGAPALGAGQFRLCKVVTNATDITGVTDLRVVDVTFVLDGGKIYLDDGVDDNVIGFPSGTKMVFYQASAPTGWTKDATNNDMALRVVSGSGGGTGGTHNFSSPPSHTHTFSHKHESPISTEATVIYTNSTTAPYGSGGTFSATVVFANDGAWLASVNSALTNTPYGGSTTSTSSATYTPKYIDVIVCEKD